MQPQVFTLRNREVARNLFRVVGDLFAGRDAPDELIDVVIREHKKDRSLAQNRLSHLWYKERAEYFGTTPEYEHRFCKLRYGCPLLMAEDEDFARLYHQVIESLDYEDRIKAMKIFSVTRVMKTKTMAQYLTHIEMDSVKHGVPLTKPADVYEEAMGRRK